MTVRNVKRRSSFLSWRCRPLKAKPWCSRAKEIRTRPRAVKLGERDALNAEVLEGLKEGEEVVVEQSYLIKADLEKESAGHEH